MRTCHACVARAGVVGMRMELEAQVQALTAGKTSATER